MKQIFKGINKLFFTDKLFEKLAPKEKQYFKDTERHFVIITPEGYFYSLTHSSNEKTYIFAKQQFRFKPYLISINQDFKGGIQPQFIGTPGHDLRPFFDYKAIEVFRHKNKDKFEFYDKFYQEHEQKILKTTYLSQKNEGILYIEKNQIQIKQIHYISTENEELF